MFVKKHSRISRAHISKSKICFNVKSSAYYFRMKTKILADFQICISVPLMKRKKGLGHFLAAFKAFKTQKEIHHYKTLEVFNTEKRTPSLFDDF